MTTEQCWKLEGKADEGGSDTRVHEEGGRQKRLMRKL